MVPGMTERDRLVADTQRLEWLSGAGIGPARSNYETRSQRAASAGNASSSSAPGSMAAGRSPAMALAKHPIEAAVMVHVRTI